MDVMGAWKLLACPGGAVGAWLTSGSFLGGSAEPSPPGWEKGEPQLCAITPLQPAWL